MSAQPLLIELVTEELPPRALRKLGTAFAASIEKSLAQLHLLPNDYTVQSFATPRRLAVLITQVLEQAPEQPFTEKLMPRKVGLTESGEPTPALLKKLDAKGLSHLGVDQLQTVNDGKQEYLVAQGMAKGAVLADQLQNVIDTAISQLPIPKVMRYQLADGKTSVRFVRPAHGLVVLYGHTVMPCTVLGIDSGRTSAGHRFMGHAKVDIADPLSYEEALLKQGMVMASYEKRRQCIADQLAEKAKALNATLGDDPVVEDLLDEVTSLVEHPTVYVGQFEDKFLDVPQECLILTMRLNQKYFPLFDPQTHKLKNQFLIVSNMQVDDPHHIIQGNERVVRPRLADAEFFFTTDQKTPQEDRVALLKNVVYHNQLGTQFERSQRVQAISAYLAQQLHSDVELAKRAAYLAKADLPSNMVGEFPELQGIMAAYYAQAEKEPQPVVQALGKQYLVRFDEPVQASNLTAIILFMAERLETLVGIWGIGSIPTGDRDPYGLRRAALGLLSAYEQLIKANVLNASHTLNLKELLQFTFDQFTAQLDPDTVPQVYHFILERYRHQLQGEYPRQVVDAVLEVNPPIEQVQARIQAVQAFSQLPEAQSLAAANKRIGNLLKKVDGDLPALNPALLVEPAEKALAHELDVLKPKVIQAYEQYDFTQCLSIMAAIRPQVDQFFTDVMVMADDLAVRQNRLALLKALHYGMNLVADISKLA